MKKIILFLGLFICFFVISFNTSYNSVKADNAPIFENDFDDYKGIEQGHSDLLFDGVSGWSGFSCVTTDPTLVINGCASYRISIPAHSAWKQAAVVSLPSSSKTYTVTFKYRMVSGDGTIKFGGETFEKSSNRGLGFNNNGDAGHNIITDDYKIVPLGNGVWFLVVVFTAQATDEYVYFSSMDKGAEYIIDDLAIYEGNTIHDIESTPNVFVYPETTNLVQTADFEDGMDEFSKQSENVSTSIVNNGVKEKSLRIDFVNAVSDQTHLVSKQLTLEANTYYTVNLKLNHLPTWDRWFHVCISNSNLQLVDYYMNLYTAEKGGFTSSIYNFFNPRLHNRTTAHQTRL